MTLNQSDILSMDASTLSRHIQNRNLSIEYATRTFIAHIEAINKDLNAVVETRFTEAIAEAKEKDAALNTTDFNTRPLFGVPMSVKESINVKQMQTTGGLIHRKDIIMSEDAVVIEKLKAAGAIILCKTNTPTLCFCQETDNKLFGKTNNAWSKKHTAGGSSGGEAALIATGGVAFGLGSDIGGSIRFPSHFNGIYGFKPGKYQVSTVGHFPADESIPLQERMSSIGPMGKSVADLELIYNIISDVNIHKRYYEKMDIEILKPDNVFPLGPETSQILSDINEFLSSYFQVEESIPPYFNDSAILWQEIMSINGAKHIKQLAFNSDKPNLWKHFAMERMTHKSPIHNYLTWALIGANMFKPSNQRVREIEAFIDEGDFVLNNYFKNKMMILPVYHQAALEHGQLYKEIFSIKKTYQKFMPYTAYANVWGLPSLTIPIRKNDKGLPIGVQIVSISGNEEEIFAIGALLEEKFQGYERSTIYDQ